MMLDVAGGVIIAAAVCGLFMYGIVSVILDHTNDGSHTRVWPLVAGAGSICVLLSVGAGVLIVLN